MVESEQNKNKWRRVGQDGEEEEDDEAEEEDEEDEDYDDALIFLPTGLSRRKPPRHWKGSDPEWQEFRRVATDRPRVERIRAELVRTVRETAIKQPWCDRRLGKVDTSKGKVWFEVTFPDGPPPEFERPGIELTEDLQWRRTTRPVETSHHIRLERALYPTTTAAALYRDAKCRAVETWESFRAYIGWEKNLATLTTEERARRFGLSMKAFPEPKSPGTTDTKPNTAASASEAQVANPAASPTTSTGLLGAFVLPDPKKLTLDMTRIKMQMMSKNQPIPQFTRGSFVVKGLVEVHGDRARMTFNVAAAYDPKQGRFVHVSMAAWNMVEHRQVPKGGP